MEGMKIYVAHASGFDFRTKLYEPLRASALDTEHEILLPQEGPIEEITRDMLGQADALVADVSMPSLGVGIEIGWADSFSMPVIAIYEKGSTPSFSIDNAVTTRFEYENGEDLVEKLTAALAAL